MTEAVALFAGVTVLSGAAVLLSLPDDESRWSVEVSPDLEAEHVETTLGLVAGLPSRTRVCFSTTGTNGAVSHAIVSTQAALETVRAGLYAVAPGIRIGIDADAPTAKPVLRARAGWRGTHVLLRQDQRELAVAAVLGALRGTSGSERIELRTYVRPIVRPKPPALPAQRHQRHGTRWLDPDVLLPTDQLRRVRAQYGGPLLSAYLEILIWGATLERARRLLSRVVAAIRGRSGLRGRLSVRTHRFALPGPRTMLGPPELVPLVGWPLRGAVIPGVTYARGARLLPDPAIPPTGGRTFGRSTWPGMEDRTLAQPVEGSLSHAVLTGPSGSGKSVLLTRLMLDDIAAGRGTLLLDMKGDTADDVLSRITPERTGDVVVLDPSDSRPLPGIKALGAGSPELTADLWTGLFRSLFPEAWGVLSDRYLRIGVQTLALSNDSLITDLPRVFRDEQFRLRLLTKGSARKALLAAWETFDSMTPARQAEHVSAPLGKVQDVLGRDAVRAVLAQPRPRMTLARAIAERRIVVVRLAPGMLGSATAQLLGAVAMHEVHQAVVGRIKLNPADRAPFGVYVDEPAVLRLLPVPLDSLYELARGLGVGITTATQSLRQLPPDIQRSLLTNAATLVSFRTDQKDAQLVTGELQSVTAEQVQHLARFETVLRIGLAHGQVSLPTTARTLALPAACSDPEIVRDEASKRYGTSIDLASNPRDREPQVDDAPVGRRRRRSK